MGRFGRRWRQATSLLPALDILLALVLKEAEVLVHLLKGVVVAIEGVDDVVLVNVNLIVNRQILLKEVNELFHFFAEELVDVIEEFDA